MLELLLIGAGPHNLCLLLRLLEPLRAPVDAVRRPPSSKRDAERRAHKQRCCKEYRAALEAWLDAHVAVVDERGDWMDRWCAQFSGLQIPFLRSNSGLHVDPHDAYSLTHFAEAAGRAKEVQPLRHVGKSAAFHGPFHTPGAALFEDHCADCVDRYCLGRVVRRGKVIRLDPVFGPDGRPTHTRTTLADGTVIAARRVALGIGSTNMQRLPGFAADAADAPPGRVLHAWDLVEAAAGDGRGTGGGAGLRLRRTAALLAAAESGASEVGDGSDGGDGSPALTADDDSSDASGSGLDGGEERGDLISCRGGGGPGPLAQPGRVVAEGQCRSRLAEAGLVGPGEHVVIVGGGLTSAHLAHLAFAGGAARVSLLTRGPLRIKQFDVDIAFMGRLRGDALAAFRRKRGADARLAALRRALQGGSITPEAWASLEPFRRAGTLDVHEGAAIAGAEWDDAAGLVAVWTEDGSLELAADRLWLATGSAVDAAREPLLAGLLEALPVPLHGGLPAVQDDLEWCPGSGVYVLGAYAALQLGPGALNLAGAKTGTALVADAIRSKCLAAAGGGSCGGSGARRALAGDGCGGGCGKGGWGRRSRASASGSSAAAVVPPGARGAAGKADGGGGGAAGADDGAAWLHELSALQARYLLPAGGA